MPEAGYTAPARRGAWFRSAATATLVLAIATIPAIAVVTDKRAAQLERLVLQDCGSCHGMTLKGGLGPDIRATTLAGTPREALVAIILDGVPDKAMPPWRPLLSVEEAGWIADYLLTETGK